MKLKSLTKLAAVSAVALGAALNGGISDAANEIGSSQVITLGATVDNDATLTIVAGTVTFSAVGHATDTATGILAPSGLPTNDTGTGAGLGSLQPASLVFDPGAGIVMPSIAISASSFGNLELFVGIDPAILPADLTCGVGGTVRIAALTTDQATPLIYTMPSGGPAVSTPGHGAMVAGATTVTFGVTLETGTGMTPTTIKSGACAGGTFNVILSY